ncbi:MAG: hypothetical protein J5876_01100 [Lachnospiraceae bacterium]|nr:hypothetical protein [Lachnospiraceae bacterium]MBO4462318.1 hypothetical protein [Lachnospiraceae bacterium]
MSLLDRLADRLLGIKKTPRQYVRIASDSARNRAANAEHMEEYREVRAEVLDDVIKASDAEKDLRRELDNTMAEMMEKIDELQGRLEDSIKKSSDDNYADLKAHLDEEIGAFKTELKDGIASIEDKIHSENVKTYRNIQALVSDIDKKAAKESTIDSKFSAVKRMLGVTVWMGLLTFAVLTIFVLYSMGVF